MFRDNDINPYPSSVRLAQLIRRHASEVAENYSVAARCSAVLQLFAILLRCCARAAPLAVIHHHCCARAAVLKDCDLRPGAGCLQEPSKSESSVPQAATRGQIHHHSGAEPS